MYLLGQMYLRGEGPPKNLVSAHMWFNLAAANGQGMGRWMRDEIAVSMDPEDIALAQRRARACMMSGYRACN
jgi:TPR repeat protein